MKRYIPPVLLIKNSPAGDAAKHCTACRAVFIIRKVIFLQIKNPHILRRYAGFCWRSKRDLNSRGPFGPYALSRGASSTS